MIIDRRYDLYLTLLIPVIVRNILSICSHDSYNNCKNNNGINNKENDNDNNNNYDDDDGNGNDDNQCTILGLFHVNAFDLWKILGGK